jgi:hypothetical protein
MSNRMDIFWKIRTKYTKKPAKRCQLHFLKVRVQKGRFSAPKQMLPMFVFSKRLIK